MYAVIVENDKSQWNDETGIRYHFPKRYKSILQPGCKVVYYKGRLKDKEYARLRMTAAPHYFATAVIGEVSHDPDSNKGDLFAEIINYNEFSHPTSNKEKEVYLETIPKEREKNYWRDGVRKISKSDYEKIIGLSKIEFMSSLSLDKVSENRHVYELSVKSAHVNSSIEDYFIDVEREGTGREKLAVTYERSKRLREYAIGVHGSSCLACGFNFGEFYGHYAKGYIHVHHVKPVSKLHLGDEFNPKEDLIPLCANCHAVVHLKKGRLLTLQEIREIILSVK